MEGIALLVVGVLAVFVGLEVVAHAPPEQHPALLSGTNAVHGTVLVGAILVTGHAGSWFAVALGLVAIVLATVNLVGGFAVTDRTLRPLEDRPVRRRVAGRES